MATAPISRSAPTASPPSCHTRMLSTMPPMPKTDRTAPTESTCAIAGVRRVAHELDAGQDDRDDHDLEQRTRRATTGRS